MRAKYKVGDRVLFTFAGCDERATIISVGKDIKGITYVLQDVQYKYPIKQEQIKSKL